MEHPITEEVLRVDLVKEQINIANNLPLRLKQSDIEQNGYSIECRICAEDAECNFMPIPGIIKQMTEPLGLGIRVDNYVYEGYEIPMHYDPMIGKLIVWAKTRSFAMKRMRRALYEYKITGVKTNINYLRRILDTSDFVRGKYNTGFIEKNTEFLMQNKYEETKEEVEDIAIIAAYMDYILNLEENVIKTGDNRKISRWREFGKRNAMLRI